MQEKQRNGERSGDDNKDAGIFTHGDDDDNSNDNDELSRDLANYEDQWGIKRSFRRDKNTDHYDEDFTSAKRKCYRSWSEYICRFEPKPWGWQWRSWYFYRAARENRKTYNYRYPKLHVEDECYNYRDDHLQLGEFLLLHS
jgi:hypothetical protein